MVWACILSRIDYNRQIDYLLICQCQVCHCKKACTCVFTYMRENQLARADTLSVLSESWLMIAQAVSDDYKDFELAQGE